MMNATKNRRITKLGFEKHIFIFVILFYSSKYCSIAQEKINIDSSLQKTKIYASITSTHTTINDANSSLIGLDGLITLNNEWSIGLAANYLPHSIPLAKNYNVDSNLITGFFSSGGIICQYSKNPDNLIHYTFSIFIGQAVFAYSKIIKTDTYFKNYRIAEIFYIAEPSINIELNMLSYLKIGCGISYRYTSDFYFKESELKNMGLSKSFTKESLNNISLSIFCKFKLL